MQVKRRNQRQSSLIFTFTATVLLLLSGCVSEEETDQQPEPNPSEDESERLIPPENEEEPEPETDVPEAYGVSAGHPDAVEAGMTVLENGGNAVDAAVAAAYAISVVEPFASGIGGGGVTLVQEQGQDPEAYDYREVVPEGGIPSSDIGVPGFVAGTKELHDDYGTADWETVIDPAIDLAESSEVSATLAQQLQSAQDRLPVEQLEHFYPDGTAIEAGATLEQPALAEALRDIRDSEGASFYEGDTGEALAAIQGLDGDSLADFRVGRHAPVTGEFAGYEVTGAPPPLPGASVIQMLQILEERGTLEEERNSTPFVHDIAMSWRIAQAFIYTDFGDLSFVDVPVDSFVDREQNAALAEEISGDSLLPEDEERSYDDSAPNTTHITVIDDNGTVVSMTNTLTNFFGSGVYTEGFFLNNQMSRFDIGQTEQNEPEPGRRSVTWSSPMIVADEEGPVLGIGSPGGERIPIMLTQVIADWVQEDSDLEAVVEADRFHLTDNALVMESAPEADVREGLLNIGYNEIREAPTPLYFGSVQALMIDRENDDISGAADPRREADWRVEPRD
ncbi:gamma-glutamyltranspeptidase [Oceanobacillus oncorhynchi subsp. incaldanensis]|uniref:Capsule biosynthesis protein CapD n=1 Tax=Oceanobacillus oncorhynchi TaxID=545501 RepID=A0A0A1MVK1_9BACI|nr:gamma-glutamyltransferase [Oceanobacillus oncorhynchi]GIO17329.1 gamma-glutamyltranspeptidase [Oceanobacillus oncorhynchi subsp. incaldanensis]CEI83624.1 Capsule biosynthesis protein CapD precursor [Oceanobacillus oncorhynchi]